MPQPQHHNGGHNGGGQHHTPPHHNPPHHNPPHHNPPHGGGHNHPHNPHHNHNHNTTHRCGHSFRGRNYRNWCFRRGWLGWTRRRFCRRLGCWLFWCPGACWYIYYVTEGVYVPCDELTDENCDD